MNRDREEKQIRELFGEVKRREERITPSFSRTWEAVRSRHKPVRSFQRHLKIAAGFATVLVLVITLPLFHSECVRQPDHDFPGGYSITEWEPLTDCLLELPYDQLLRSVPQFDYLAMENGLVRSEQNP